MELRGLEPLTFVAKVAPGGELRLLWGDFRCIVGILIIVVVLRGYTWGARPHRYLGRCVGSSLGRVAMTTRPAPTAAA